MAYVKCPHCGKISSGLSGPLRRRTTTFESSARSPLKNTAAILPPPPLSIERPIGLPSMESHVHVPVNQALITGCLFAPVIGLTIFSIAYIGRASTGEALLSGFITGGIALFSTATWQWLSKTAFYDSLLQTVETELGVDLDGDGEIGTEVIQTEVKVNSNWVYADLPHDRGNEKALIDFLGGVIAGTVTFSQRGAADSGYSVTQFNKLRTVFIKSGFAYRKGKADNSPIVFTVAGNAVLRDVVNNPPPDNYEGEGSRGMSSNYIERGSKRESWS